MKINNIVYNSNYKNSFSGKVASAKAKSSQLHRSVTKMPLDSIKANFALSFCGNAPKIKRAFIITGEEKNTPIASTSENSYIVDFESQTELIYGEHAIDYLESRDVFEYETQIVIPSKAKATFTKNGQEIALPQNSAVMVKPGTKAKVTIDEGYPMVLISKRDPEWYSRHSKNSPDETVRNKFQEMIYYNSHLYNGAITPSVLLSSRLIDPEFLSSIGINKYSSNTHLLYDLYDRRDSLNEQDRQEVTRLKNLVQKLYDKGYIYKETNESDEYFSFVNYFTPEFLCNKLKNDDFSDQDIATIIRLYGQVRSSKMASKFIKVEDASVLPESAINKLKKARIIFDNKSGLDKIYLRKCYGNVNQLRRELFDAGLSEDEVNLFVKQWTEDNKIGFDLTGLKYIDEDCAVYDLNDKLNNWTLEETNWVTNSTALLNSSGLTPVDGVSIVHSDKNGYLPMSSLRRGEHFHMHPLSTHEINGIAYPKKQDEIYLITSGQADLAVCKNGKLEHLILKEGDLAVVGSGVGHCMIGVNGEYEQIVSQVPSAFQYATSFKQNIPLPDGITMQDLTDQCRMIFQNK